MFSRNYEGQYQGNDAGTHGSAKLELGLTADEDIPNRMIVDYGFYLEFETDSTLIVPVQSLNLGNDTVTIQGLGEYSLESLSIRFAEIKSEGLLSDDWLFNFTGIKVKSDM